jgi:2-polyprenyl-6-methoxyphenol hydroxylase-like FAD-dependent oxidoreductase
VKASPPRAEKIAVIGAGPAGLTYASLVAQHNQVTVFERDATPGGSFRYAGKAPLFQDVEARSYSFERYVRGQVAACTAKGVTFKYNTDVAKNAALLAPFDRIVIASGASYRFGLGRLPFMMLDIGAGRWPGLAQVFSNAKFRDWFYHRARVATGDAFKAFAKPNQKIMVIGDARAPGKSRPAIESAFEAALLN